MKEASFQQKSRIMEIMKKETGEYPSWESLDNMTGREAWTIIAEHRKKWEDRNRCKEELLR